MATSRARTGMALSLLLAVTSVLLLTPHGEAQPSSGSGGGSCTMEIVSLAPCLGYTSGNASKPSSSCCSALSSVATSNPRCLCSVLGGGASSLGITINDTRALELPGACGVKTPPASQCKSVGIPVPSPPATPATPTPSTTTPASPATPRPSTRTPASPTTPPVPSVTPAAGAGSKATQTAQSSGSPCVGKVIPVAAAILSAAFALFQA